MTLCFIGPLMMLCRVFAADATTEFANARAPRVEEGIHFKGLSCATILIGAYDTTSGRPIAGVISRPFTRTSDPDSSDQ